MPELEHYELVPDRCWLFSSCLYHRWIISLHVAIIGLNCAKHINHLCLLLRSRVRSSSCHSHLFFLFAAARTRVALNRKKTTQHSRNLRSWKLDPLWTEISINPIQSGEKSAIRHRWGAGGSSTISAACTYRLNGEKSKQENKWENKYKKKCEKERNCVLCCVCKVKGFSS